MTATTIALVTGGARGIGREVTRSLAALGHVVLAGVRDPDRAKASLSELPGEIRALHLDVTDGATVDAAARAVEAEFGRLDVLVNNAGIIIERDADPLTVDADTVRATFDTNVFGVIAVTRAFVPLLRRSPGGRIVNVSSAMGSLGEWTDPDSMLAVHAPVVLGYNASKTALNAVTVVYARALAETAVKVNSADPGYVATDLNGHSGFRTVEEGARIIVELATLGPDGPTGVFLGDTGPVRW